jgi:hypothetical protein
MGRENEMTGDKSGMFRPHHNLSDQINGNIIRSEIEGGVYLKDLPDESTLEVVTQNRWYTLVVRRDGQALISGHPEFCPQPVLVRMHLEYRHPNYRGPIVTSPIVDIRLKAA